jgi:hypothetical protein
MPQLYALSDMARLLVIALVLVPSLARADAIAIPDTPCPAGSARQIAGHGGTWCGPVPCGAGQTCAGTCREVALCTGTGTHYVEHGHLATSPPSTPAEHVEAYGPCGLAGGCERGTCTTEQRCVAEDAPVRAEPIVPTTPAPASSSTCSVASRPSWLFASVLALALAIFGCRRG